MKFLVAVRTVRELLHRAIDQDHDAVSFDLFAEEMLFCGLFIIVLSAQGTNRRLSNLITQCFYFIQESHICRSLFLHDLGFISFM